MEINYIFIGVIVILALVLLYLGYVFFIKNKDLKTDLESSVDLEMLLNALGGKDNIMNVKSSPSKLSVGLKDRNKISVETIQKLGASGIVEGKEQISMIFGKQSELIEKDLKKYL